MRHVLLIIHKKTHEKYVVESRAERQEKKREIRLYVHESNRSNFVTFTNCRETVLSIHQMASGFPTCLSLQLSASCSYYSSE